MLKTRELTQLALLSALSYILSLFELFKMPYGGSFTLYLFPMFIIAYYYDLPKGLITGFVIATLNIISGGYILNPIQLILDYYFPVMIITSAMIFGKKNRYISISISLVLAYLSYVISGIIFFKVPLLGSLAYNATYFGPTIILNFIIFLLINNRIKHLFKQ